MLRAAILFLNGGMVSTAVLPLEILRSVGVFWNLLNDLPPEPRFQVAAASCDGKPVRIGQYKTLTPDHSFATLERPDVVVVPSGGYELTGSDGSVKDINGMLQLNAAAVPWLKKWADDGAHMVGIGTGVVLMAAAGLLDGRQAPSHWGVVDRHRDGFPTVDWRTEFTVTTSGRTYCGAGFSAILYVMVVLIEKLFGPEVALQTATAHLLDIPRMHHVGDGDVALRDGREDGSIREVEKWLNRHYADNINFVNVAKEMGMSHRNFARRFKLATGTPPLAYLQHLRISTAIRLIEDTRLPLSTIAERVGYRDIVHFRTLFKRRTGKTPTAYRKQYAARTERRVK